MKEGLIGVIVPVYKVEKYIAECIESILAQIYTHFRLILVDDRSRRNSLTASQRFAQSATAAKRRSQNHFRQNRRHALGRTNHLVRF